MTNAEIEFLARRFDESLKQFREDVGNRLDKQDQQLEAVDTKIENTVSEINSLKLWRARCEGLFAGYRWVMPIVCSLTSGGLITAILALTGKL